MRLPCLRNLDSWDKHAFLPYGICCLKIGNVISFKWFEMGFGVKRIIHFLP